MTPGTLLPHVAAWWVAHPDQTLGALASPRQRAVLSEAVTADLTVDGVLPHPVEAAIGCFIVGVEFEVVDNGLSGEFGVRISTVTAMRADLIP